MLDLLKKFLDDNNLAILLDRFGFKANKKIINGILKYGYGITKDGDFMFKLPNNYYNEYKRYTFNFWRNIILLILAIIGILTT